MLIFSPEIFLTVKTNSRRYVSSRTSQDTSNTEPFLLLVSVSTLPSSTSPPSSVPVSSISASSVPTSPTVSGVSCSKSLSFSPIVSSPIMLSNSLFTVSSVLLAVISDSVRLLKANNSILPESSSIFCQIINPKQIIITVGSSIKKTLKLLLLFFLPSTAVNGRPSIGSFSFCLGFF